MNIFVIKCLNFRTLHLVNLQCYLIIKIAAGVQLANATQTSVSNKESPITPSVPLLESPAGPDTEYTGAKRIAGETSDQSSTPGASIDFSVSDDDHSVAVDDSSSRAPTHPLQQTSPGKKSLMNNFKHEILCFILHLLFLQIATAFSLPQLDHQE